MAGRPKTLHPEEVMEFLLAQEDNAKAAEKAASEAYSRQNTEFFKAQQMRQHASNAVIAYRPLFQAAVAGKK